MGGFTVDFVFLGVVDVIVDLSALDEEGLARLGAGIL